MAKPLVPATGNVARDLQFTHFGVLNAGHQGSGAFFTSLITNLLLAFVVCVIGASATRTLERAQKVVFLTVPIEPLKSVPVPPKPKVMPKPPVLKVATPKITVPQVRLPDPRKSQIVAMARPEPVIPPAPPKAITAPAAPRVVSFAHPMAASVVNNSPHPSAVALGRPDNPITPSARPATNAVDLGQRGLPGMPASNTGGGPPATKVNLGSGSAASQSLTGNGVRPVQGVKLGVPGGTGPMNAPGRQIGQVNLGRSEPPPAPIAAGPAKVSMQTAPKVLYKPTPAYTREAAALHISGSVAVRIRVAASGAVSVLELTNGLGHGLDESAKVAVLGTRVAPARDGNGHPVDWEGVVLVNFQLVGS
jgi:protein TonB